MAFYEKYVARSALLDYIEMVCKNIAKHYVDPPDWWSPPPPVQPPPKLRKPDVRCYEDRYKRYCVRCEKDAEEEAKELEEEKQKASEEKKDARATKLKARATLLKRAKKGS